VLTTKPAVSNLLVSTIHGQEVSLLLISRGAQGAEESVDFLLKYKAAGHFLIEPDYPTSLVAQTLTLGSANTSNTMPASGPGTSAGSTESIAPVSTVQVDPPTTESADAPGAVRRGGLDELLTRQERAPLPVLYGERVAVETASGDHVRAGISEVIDGGQQVIVLLSAVNPGPTGRKNQVGQDRYALTLVERGAVAGDGLQVEQASPRAGRAGGRGGRF